MASGPLRGLRILEFAGIGPVPFCGMLLSDLGAEVVRIDRRDGDVGVAALAGRRFAVTDRGRQSIALDLKRPEAIEMCARLAQQADALIEGFRPGVMERLGLGPDELIARNPSLVYGRMSGWGQDGPLAQEAGHDVNYIALSGALAAIGSPDRPAAPLNLVGDFGGGALYLAFGLLAGVLHARASGTGQVVDCAMSDGSASLMAMFYGLHAAGLWNRERESNLLDGGAPFYGAYRCADDGWIAVGALEKNFHAAFISGLGLDPEEFASARADPANWQSLRTRIEARVATRARDEWCALFAGTDACVTPILDMAEAPRHPHHEARGAFVEVDGVVQPAPAPRFSVTPGSVQGPPPERGADARLVLGDWGFAPEEVDRLADLGVIDD